MAQNEPYFSSPYFSFGPTNWSQMWPMNIVNNPNDPIPSGLSEFGRSILNPEQNPGGPIVSQPPFPLLDFTQPPQLPSLEDINNGLHDFFTQDYVQRALPFPGSAALPAARDIYNLFAGEDANARANAQQPPELEAIIREANKNRPRNDSPNSMEFSLGSLPPESMFHVDPTGMVGNVDYSRFAEMLPGAKRVQREVQPPTDFSAAEAAMQAAKPTYEEGNKWGQVLQGLARGGLSARNGDFSEILFSAALGALGGLGSGMDIEQERKDLAKGREQQFNERLAGFDLEKAGTQRSEKQQAADAAYEADVNYNQADAARQQQIVSILMHGADQNAENTRHNASIAASTANMNRDLALKRYAMEQPNVDVNQYGLVVTKTGPNGERTMTIDNSPWVQRLQTQAMYRKMGVMGAAPGADFPGMGFTNDKEIDTQELTRRLSTYYFMNPMAAAQDLNGGEGGDIMNQMAMQTRQMLGGSQDSKMFPQMMANNLYSYLAPIIANPEHPLHGAVLKRMAEMQGMF